MEGFINENGRNWISIGYDLLENELNLPKCFVKSEMIMGFSAVAMTKGTLNRFCNSGWFNDYILNDDCFAVDDDWLSRIYNKLGFKLISSREIVPVLDVETSDKDGWSNRESYIKKRTNCIMNIKSNDIRTLNKRKLLIETAIITTETSLHNLDEYRNTFNKLKSLQQKYSEENGYQYKIRVETKLERSHWVKIEIIQDFINRCKTEDVLFYTDIDFIFTSTNFPDFKENKAIILSRGCQKDLIHLMVGNMIIKCDKRVSSLLSVWLAATRIISKAGEMNDDQVAFNLISPRFMDMIQVDHFFSYDDCLYNIGDIVGIHFPGPNKRDRIYKFLENYPL
jgi:hypothetical protein